MPAAIHKLAKPATQPVGYVIEKGVPYEPVVCHKYPVSQMEIGDSFLVTDPQDCRRAAATCSNYGRRNGKVFRSKKCPQGIRIWRVA
jgi:hypothetical protein